MKPLDIVINKTCLERVAKFFTPPDNLNTLSAENLQQQAYETMNSISETTKAQLADAINNHKTIDLQVSVQVSPFSHDSNLRQAPTIIIPENPSSKSSALLVMDLGKLTMKSHSQKTKTITDSQSLQIGDLYDQYTISLTKIKLLIVPSSELNWRNEEVLAFLCVLPD